MIVILASSILSNLMFDARLHQIRGKNTIFLLIYQSFLGFSLHKIAVFN